MALDEFALIRRYFTQPTARRDVILSVGDDAALLAADPKQELAVTTDTMLAGVHFEPDLPADAAARTGDQGVFSFYLNHECSTVRKGSIYVRIAFARVGPMAVAAINPTARPSSR